MSKNGDAVAIYSRKSKFTGKGESIGNQVELCKEYVRNMFGEEYADRCVVFEDEGFSGGNLQRPVFKRMMEDVRKHKFQAVVVYRLDRISRNISDFTGLIDELTKLNVSFASIKEQFDTSTPMGRAMMFIICVFSQLAKSWEFYTGKREQYEKQLGDLRAEYAQNEQTINGLIDSLVLVGESLAKSRVLKRIEDLSEVGRDKEIPVLSDTPATGGNSNIMLYSSMFTVSLAVLAVPGHFFFREFQVGVVHSVLAKMIGASHLFVQ